MLQEYLEEQLLTPIRSKVRQDVGLEEPNSRLRRSLYGPTLNKLVEESCVGPAVRNLLGSSAGKLDRQGPTGSYWRCAPPSVQAPAVLLAGTWEATTSHDPHHPLGCPSGPVETVRFAKPG